VPISVDGRLWGVMLVAHGNRPLPPDTEVRLSGFTDLAREQAALRRVATLVARGASPEGTVRRGHR
jgi:hypothetical protein